MTSSSSLSGCFSRQRATVRRQMAERLSRLLLGGGIALLALGSGIPIAFAQTPAPGPGQPAGQPGQEQTQPGQPQTQEQAPPAAQPTPTPPEQIPLQQYPIQQPGRPP